MANTITSHYFLSVFDEFKAVPVAKIDALIGVASLRVNPAVWGAGSSSDLSPYATALLTAHMLAVGGGLGGHGGAAGGPLSSESVGDLSRSFGTVGQAGTGDQELLTTRYGQEFVALRREVIIPCFATGPVTFPGVC